MTEIEKGIRMFLKELKRFGIFDEYMAERLHQGDSDMANTIGKLANEIRLYAELDDISQYHVCNYLLTCFDTPTISFFWEETKKGFEYWYKISCRLYRISHRLTNRQAVKDMLNAYKKN